MFASHGILNYIGNYDYIRPGIIMYGLTVRDDMKNISNIKLKSALKMYSKVISIKRVKKIHQYLILDYLLLINQLM